MGRASPHPVPPRSAGATDEVASVETESRMKALSQLGAGVVMAVFVVYVLASMAVPILAAMALLRYLSQ